MKYKLERVSSEEQSYLYAPAENDVHNKNRIGHLRDDFGHDGDEFWHLDSLFDGRDRKSGNYEE